MKQKMPINYVENMLDSQLLNDWEEVDIKQAGEINVFSLSINDKICAFDHQMNSDNYLRRIHVSPSITWIFKGSYYKYLICQWLKKNLSLIDQWLLLTYQIGFPINILMEKR